MTVLTKEDVRAWAFRHGYSEDRWGHLIKRDLARDKLFRLKIQPTSVRLEVRVIHNKTDYGYKPPNEWVRILSGYYKDIYITSEDKIVIPKSKR